MIKMEVKGIDGILNDVDDLIKNRIPKMTAIALTETARALKEAGPAKMQEVFDRPTRWTLNSLYYQPASPADLKAFVWFKDEAQKGTPATKFLWPEVHGGARNTKRFEKALQRIGVLPDGMQIVPGAGAQIDNEGNIDRRQITQILSYFRAFSEVGYAANITEKKKASLAKGSKRTGKRGFAYFVGRPGNGKLPLGIYQRFSFGPMGSAIKPVLLFVKGVKYSTRFPFYEWAQAFIDRELPVRLNRIIGETLAYHKAKG